MNLLGMMQTFGRGGHRGRGRGRGRWLKWILKFYTFLSSIQHTPTLIRLNTKKFVEANEIPYEI